MKTYIFLLSILFSISAKAQESDTIQSPVMKAYNDFVNYTPKAPNGVSVAEVFGQLQPDNLSKALIVYGYQSHFRLKSEETAWLNERINDLAVAFYLEGKPVLLRSTGGYSGCPESEFELKEEMLHDKAVTVVNFCHSCTGGLPHEDEFITIFNNRTKRLLEGAK